jgi:hypothetical protein
LDFQICEGKRRPSFPDFKSSSAVANLKSGFPNLRGQKKVFNLDFQICEGKRRLSFPDFKSSSAVADLKSGYPNLQGKKKVFNLDFQICEGKRRLSFPDFKSSFAVVKRSLFFRILGRLQQTGGSQASYLNRDGRKAG